MQPSFLNRGGYRRKRDVDEEMWEEDIDMDVLDEEQHDSSVEYDYDFSDDEAAPRVHSVIPGSRVKHI
ncbi:hypothetical protein BGW38_000504 [Lunasporangiospora selenospora]|uniref:Uncharacterized protein n=1 Tax=Lunasporangiospora selenospora TaxID=979761 RepID=A0A9P6KER9_9FUNG|nr:hypothetical protein BGW38_000504 [Lunasporangiospora selenospora]